MHDNCQLSASSGFQVTSSLGSEFVFPKLLPFLQAACEVRRAPGDETRQWSPRDGERASHSNQLRVTVPPNALMVLYWQ